MNQGRRPFGEAEREHLVRLYDGNVAFADQEIGSLRQALEAEGLWDKTVVIVAADHGEELSRARLDRPQRPPVRAERRTCR